MTPTEVKQILKSAWYSRTQVNRELDELDELKSLATKITPTYSLAGGGSGGDGKKLENNMVRILEAEHRRELAIQTYLEAKAKVHELIDSMDDEQLKLLLKLRYINFKKWEEIAVIMNYSWRRVNQLHSRALIILSQSKCVN